VLLRRGALSGRAWPGDVLVAIDGVRLRSAAATAASEAASGAAAPSPLEALSALLGITHANESVRAAAGLQAEAVAERGYAAFGARAAAAGARALGCGAAWAAPRAAAAVTLRRDETSTAAPSASLLTNATSAASLSVCVGRSLCVGVGSGDDDAVGRVLAAAAAVAAAPVAAPAQDAAPAPAAASGVAWRHVLTFRRASAGSRALPAALVARTPLGGVASALVRDAAADAAAAAETGESAGNAHLAVGGRPLSGAARADVQCVPGARSRRCSFRAEVARLDLVEAPTPTPRSARRARGKSPSPSPLGAAATPMPAREARRAGGGAAGTGILALPARFGGALPCAPRRVVRATPEDACAPLVPRTRGAFRGAIVVAERGGCFFAQKAAAVQAAEGSALLVVNTGDAPPLEMEGAMDAAREGASGAAIAIPAAMVSRADGDALLAALARAEAEAATAAAAADAIGDDPDAAAAKFALFARFAPWGGETCDLSAVPPLGGAAAAAGAVAAARAPRRASWRRGARAARDAAGGSAEVATTASLSSEEEQEHALHALRRFAVPTGGAAGTAALDGAAPAPLPSDGAPSAAADDALTLINVAAIEAAWEAVWEEMLTTSAASWLEAGARAAAASGGDGGGGGGGGDGEGSPREEL
jgi:hypothetical protein